VQVLRYAKLEVPAKLRQAFEKVRGAIERDDFFSADVKKLVGSGYYRAKLDYENRLLLKFVEYEGRRACLALELIEHHAYDRSRFLRGVAAGDGEQGEPIGAAALEGAAIERMRYVHPGRAEFQLLDKPLSFDDRQEELFRLPLPMILVGCAGSGKTALTLTKLRELAGRVLYVTQSAYLAESAANLYFSHGYENPEQSVDFLSYRSLLESVQVPEGRPVTLREFSGLFARHSQTLRFTTAHQLFEEIRGVLGAAAGGPLSFEQYEGLGVRQSIYKGEERRAVHGFFGKYREWLAESGLYDSNLVAHALRPKVVPEYDAVVVDEVQDLTNAELSVVLSALKSRESFLLCGDANQIVHPNFFSWSGVKSLFYSEEEAALRAKIHVLEVNYRSSRAVCRVANDLLKIKNARFGSIDRESTALVRAAGDREGKLIGLVNKDGVVRELDRRTRGSANVAVIVLTDAQKADARRRFGTPLVFSVHEAKGLEYESVILYDIVSTERGRFREVSEGVTAADLEATELEYSRAKDKADKSLEVYKFFVNALYVALTRAVDTVYLIETDTAHPLLGLLGVRCGESVADVDVKASSAEEWQKEAQRLELQGKAEQAEAIRKSILKLQPVPWPVLDAAGLRETFERALAPRSVHGKAKQRLFEFAAFNGLASVAYTLKTSADYRHPKPFDATAHAVRERAMGTYVKGDLGAVASDVRKYGLEHKSMQGMTPLMMAADAGNLALIESLLEQGARLDSTDSLGRMPIHFALRRAFQDAEFAQQKLGPMFALLCPTAIELEVEGRRVRLAKDQGEFLLLLFLVARFHELYAGMRRYAGFGTAFVSDDALAHFPRSVVPEHRRRRAYWNSVFARAEVESSYRPARRLWRRERNGHYVPSDVAAVKMRDASGAEAYVPLSKLLAFDLLESKPAPISEPFRFVREG